MYLMKMGVTTNTATTSSTIKIPKGQILNTIEQGVVSEDRLSASVVNIPISVEDTTLNGSLRVYTQKTIQKIGPSFAIKDQVLYFKSNGLNSYYTNKYFKRSLITDISEEVTGTVYILSKTSLQAYNNLGINKENNGDIFKFLVNPQNVVFNYVKSNTKVLTSAGWTFQHWGNDVPTIDVKGNTLMLKPSSNVAGNAWEKDPILTGKEYQNLSTLRTWYWEQNMRRNSITPLYRIGLYYRGVTYVGHFDNFSFVEDAEKPRVLDYSFKFVIEEEHGDGALLSDDRDQVQQ